MQVVWLCLLLALMLPARADLQANWQAAQAAREAGDHPAYLERMLAVLPDLRPRHPNRPFAQFHLARAAALNGQAVLAAAALQAMFDDRIEALMLGMALHDPAFDRVRNHPAIRAALALPDSLTLQQVPLAPGLLALEGAGSWQLLLTGPEGALLVDAGYNASVPALRRVLGGVPLRLVVVSHAHEDHSGGLRSLAPDAVVVVHPAAAAAMAEAWAFLPGVDVPAKAPAQRGDVLVDDRVLLHLNGTRIEVIASPAHSDGDLLVLFPDHQVLHMGDNWLPDDGEPGYLNPGRTPSRWLRDFAALLDRLPAQTRVVSGHHAPLPVTKLQAAYNNTLRVVQALRPHLPAGGDEPPAVPALADDSPGWVGFIWGRLRDEAG